MRRNHLLTAAIIAGTLAVLSAVPAQAVPRLDCGWIYTGGHLEWRGLCVAGIDNSAAGPLADNRPAIHPPHTVQVNEGPTLPSLQPMSK